MELYELCREMFSKDVTELNEQEQREYFNELGKYLRKGDYDLPIAYLMFKKRVKDLTNKEASQYNMYLKNGYRVLEYNSVNKRLFHKKLKDLTDEEYMLVKVIRERENHDRIKEDVVMKLYGKPYNELTVEETLDYHKNHFTYKSRDYDEEKTKAFKIFGKARKDLNPKELREYNRLLQKEYRLNNKEN